MTTTSQTLRAAAKYLREHGWRGWLHLLSACASLFGVFEVVANNPKPNLWVATAGLTLGVSTVCNAFGAGLLLGRELHKEGK